MPADHIDGPIRISVTATPGGPALDLSAFAELVVGDVLDLLLDPQDTSLWDRLHELADGPVATDGRLLFEELQRDLADRASSRVPLCGWRQVLTLIQQLRSASGPFVLTQQDRRAS